MNIDHLKALVAAAKSSEHLYEEQAAAMEFTLAYGEQLLALVEAAQQHLDCDGGMTHTILRNALLALEGEI